MAYTTIKKPSDYFNTKLYTGNGSTQSITGVGFQPDFTWLKVRNALGGHGLFDVIRGANKRLISNESSAEGTMTDGLTSFDSDGFSVGADGNTNGSSETYVSWNWLTDNTSGSSNTDGSITSTVSANTTSGFSIVTYTGNTDASKTIGHGLGTAPSMIITKDRGNTRNWCVYHKSLGATKHLLLNGNGAVSTSTGRWNDTEPTSSVFTVGDDAETGNAFNYVAYCFAEKQGFSKFGSYTANGLLGGDENFVYCGFSPAFVMIKKTNAIENWYIFDDKRDSINPNELDLKANNTDQELTLSGGIDFLSNGFKIRTSDSAIGAGDTYCYVAFAKEPLVGDNPATAR